MEDYSQDYGLAAGELKMIRALSSDMTTPISRCRMRDGFPGSCAECTRIGWWK